MDNCRKAEIPVRRRQNGLREESNFLPRYTRTDNGGWRQPNVLVFRKTRPYYWQRAQERPERVWPILRCSAHTCWNRSINLKRRSSQTRTERAKKNEARYGGEYSGFHIESGECSIYLMPTAAVLTVPHLSPACSQRLTLVCNLLKQRPEYEEKTLKVLIYLL